MGGQQLLIVDGGTCGMSEEEELALATAIFELGLKYSSPKVLLELMPKDAGLNTEHLKSHLQKYRTNRERSRQEFRLYHEDFIKKVLRDYLASGCGSSSNPDTIADQLEERMTKLE